MKSVSSTINFSLSNQTVDAVSDYVQSYFSAAGVEKKNIARYRLTIEELLLQWLDRYGEGGGITVTTGRRFLRQNLSIWIDGEAYDPFKTEQETIGCYSTSLLKTIGLTPEYSYSGNKNCFSFSIKRNRKNPLVTLLITVIAAFVVGFAGMWLPESVRSLLLNDVIAPIHDTFLNLLSCAAGPMIFLSVTWGIYGIGDTSTLSKIGKKMILHYIGVLYCIILITGMLILPLFHLNFAGSVQDSTGIEAIFRLLLDIIPKNIFSPFVDGNSLQIIYLAFIIGIALLFLGRKTSAVARAVEQINYIVQFLMEFISTLVPYFIFIVMLQFIWSDTLRTLIGVAKLLSIFIGSVLFMAIAVILITAWRQKANPFLLIKKGLPTLLIAITTASSAASFGTNRNACENKYGIDRSITSFGIPLGMVMFKPTTAISYLTFALFFSEMYHIACSPAWLLLVFVIVGVLAIATPPIPGGALTAYTIIFTQLGIPLEALSIALAIDVVIDFIATGFDQFVLPFSLTNQARRIGLLDSKKLRSK